MNAVLLVLFVEVVPFCFLISDAFPRCQLDPALDGPRPRRSRFWLRFSGVVIAIWLPVLVAFVAPLSEHAAGLVLVWGLTWGILVVALSRLVLFEGPRVDPGSADGDDGGPGPGGADRPTPPAPIGGIPLLDAEPASTRLRDHRGPQWGPRPRRPVRQRERLVSRPWPLT